MKTAQQARNSTAGKPHVNHRIKALRDRIQELETEIEKEIAEHRQQFHYSISKKRIRFASSVKKKHQELKTGLIRFLRESGLVNVLFSPLIYVQIIPLVLLDVAVSLYQFITFPVYGIPKVPRGDFIVVDRHNLAYLNMIEKLNCVFCGYANGLLAWTREIAGRSEAYWCPIKHARRTDGQHRRYYDYPEFGDAEGYRARKIENNNGPT